MLKLPNRDEYTLDQALDYLEKFHNEKRIDKSYLLYHAKKGNLKTVIKLEIGRDFSGDDNDRHHRAKIILINNKKQVNNVYHLKNGNTKIIFNNFDIRKENSKLVHNSTRYLINRDGFFIDFKRDNIDPIFMPRFMYEKIIISKDSGEVINDITDFYLSAFFQIEPYCYIGDEEMILEHGFITKEISFGEEFVSISTKDNEYISFTLEPSEQSGIFRNVYDDFKIDIDDILILHKDLIDFLNIPETKEENTDELRQQIEKFKSELIEKDNIIKKMQSELSEKSTTKPSTKSENIKNAFIKSLLKIHYGEEVAENPRAHIYDPNMSEKSRDGKIQKDFELHGLTKNLPTGKTLKNWVDSVELDN